MSREVKRNGGIDHYRRKCKSGGLETREVTQRIRFGEELPSYERCYPQPVKGMVTPTNIWLAQTSLPKRRPLRVSHETIYRSLFIKARGLFRKEMRNHLRTKGKFRHGRIHSMASRGPIDGGIPIRDRPATIEG